MLVVLLQWGVSWVGGKATSGRERPWGRGTHHAGCLRGVGVEGVGGDDLHAGVTPAVGRRVAELMVVVMAVVM